MGLSLLDVRGEHRQEREKLKGEGESEKGVRSVWGKGQRRYQGSCRQLESEKEVRVRREQERVDRERIGKNEDESVKCREAVE